MQPITRNGKPNHYLLIIYLRKCATQQAYSKSVISYLVFYVPSFVLSFCHHEWLLWTSILPRKSPLISVQWSNPGEIIRCSKPDNGFVHMDYFLPFRRKPAAKDSGGHAIAGFCLGLCLKYLRWWKQNNLISGYVLVYIAHSSVFTWNESISFFRLIDLAFLHQCKKIVYGSETR